MIKLVIIDLDGTLLDSKKKIKDIDKEAVVKALESGVKVTIFTGRSYHSARKYLEELGVDVPVVFQNGAFIIDIRSKKVLRSVHLDASTAKEVVERSRKLDLFYIVYSDFLDEKDMLIDREYQGPYEYYLEHNLWRIKKTKDVLNELRSKDRVAEVALIGEEDKIKHVTESVDKQHASVIKSTTLENHAFYEIFGPGCSKAIALEFLLDHFGVNKDDVMFIGDGYNDIDIMKKVGIAVAMGNAPNEVKKIASFVTKSNEEGGVAEAIQRFVLKPLS